MTMFIKLKDGKPTDHPLIEQNFKELFPNIQYPAYYTPEFVEALGFGLWDFSNKPQLGRYQKAVEVAPVKNASGIWRQTFEIVEMSEEEQAETDKLKADEVRHRRSFKLAQSDWTRLDDAPLTNEQKLKWATYRQALRDVPQQAEFPWNTQWPVKP